jgi:hypothetical protein
MYSLPKQVYSSISGFTVNQGAYKKKKITHECWVGHLISVSDESITADLRKWLMTSQWDKKE